MVRVSDERALWLVRHVLPHEGALRAWLRSRPLSGMDIDDVVQETYARLVSLDSVEAIRNVRSYAFQTAHSVLLTEMRRSKVVSFQAIADLDTLGVAAEEPSPERAVSDRDELHRLREAIARLPGQVRAVFVLRRIDGLPQREVALRLGLAESTVEKHMASALRRLAADYARGGNAQPQASKVSHLADGRHDAGDGRTD